MPFKVNENLGVSNLVRRPLMTPLPAGRQGLGVDDTENKRQQSMGHGKDARIVLRLSLWS
jgi:hypothetical protein